MAVVQLAFIDIWKTVPYILVHMNNAPDPIGFSLTARKLQPWHGQTHKVFFSRKFLPRLRPLLW